ncbi:MAG: enoyl-CoA hydratase/isomerase family protein [Deltaproteobacteria bacterium]|nr:enoyl-CoA hydratase/isomerase family protein [Deltaproteobacteria bacterium]
MELQDIKYQKQDHLATITLNRPDLKNAFTLPMLKSVELALMDAKDDPGIKVIILTGAGDVFCAGGNIKDMAGGKLQSWQMKDYLWNHVQRVPLLLEDIDKPVVAMLNGPAFGGGMDLALMCDLRVASEKASLCATYVRIGLAPGDGGAFLLPRLTGLAKAMEILLTGDVIEPAEALSLGLVNKVTAHADLEAETMALAEKMSQWPLTSLRACKRAVMNGLTSSFRSHMDYISSQVAMLSATEDHLSAINRLVKGNKDKSND